MEFQWVLDLLWGFVERLSGWKPDPDTRERLQFIAALVGIGAAIFGLRAHVRSRAEQAAWRQEQKKAAAEAEKREHERSQLLDQQAKSQAAVIDGLERKFDQFAARINKLTYQDQMLSASSVDNLPVQECFEENIDLGIKFMERGHLDAARIMFEAARRMTEHKLSVEA